MKLVRDGFGVEVCVKCGADLQFLGGRSWRCPECWELYEEYPEEEYNPELERVKRRIELAKEVGLI